MFYNVKALMIGDKSIRADVELIEKNSLYTEVVRLLTFNIPISEGRTIFKDEVNPMVEQALRDAGITVEGHEFG